MKLLKIFIIVSMILINTACSLDMRSLLKNYLSGTPTPETKQPGNRPTAPLKPSAPPTPAIPVQVSPKDGAPMVEIAAGDFLMGSMSVSKGSYFANEVPQHRIFLPAYWIDQTEVTLGQFSIFIAETGYVTEAEKEKQGYVFNISTSDWYKTKNANWRQPQAQGADITLVSEEYPVTQVTYNDAVAFCAWAGRRLPTEAEWEKAARGNLACIYPWDRPDATSAACLRAPDATLLNYKLHIKSVTPVGKYRSGASPYGAMDMAGNVWEWIVDWYKDDYYYRTGDTNPLGPPEGTDRVLRGGSWTSNAEQVRAAARFHRPPNYRADDLGFRCALTIPKTSD